MNVEWCSASVPWDLPSDARVRGRRRLDRTGCAAASVDRVCMQRASTGCATRERAPPPSSFCLSACPSVCLVCGCVCSFLLACSLADSPSSAARRSCCLLRAVRAHLHTRVAAPLSLPLCLAFCRIFSFSLAAAPSRLDGLSALSSQSSLPLSLPFRCRVSRV